VLTITPLSNGRDSPRCSAVAGSCEVQIRTTAGSNPEYAYFIAQEMNKHG
jgi:hypothetical protein